LTISKHKRKVCYKRDGNKCVKCGGTEDLTVDHIIPLSLGGKCHLVNLQTMCKACNGRKGANVILYRKDKEAVNYIKKRGFTNNACILY
jgi:5-methylcytosine-specific restriction endonuclease McrA